MPTLYQELGKTRREVFDLLAKWERYSWILRNIVDEEVDPLPKMQECIRIYMKQDDITIDDLKKLFT